MSLLEKKNRKSYKQEYKLSAFFIKNFLSQELLLSHWDVFEGKNAARMGYNARVELQVF